MSNHSLNYVRNYKREEDYKRRPDFLEYLKSLLLSEQWAYNLNFMTCISVLDTNSNLSTEIVCFWCDWKRNACRPFKKYLMKNVFVFIKCRLLSYQTEPGTVNTTSVFQSSQISHIYLSHTNTLAASNDSHQLQWPVPKTRALLLLSYYTSSLR